MDIIMKYLFGLALVCMISPCAAQEIPEISGAYHVSSGDPHGGSHIVVSPDHHFAIAYFGGIKKGTWQQVGDSYEFTYHQEPKVVLYARSNPSLTDSLQIRVGLNANRGFAIRVNPSATSEFTPIFNEAANCFLYPYIYKQTQKITSIEIYQDENYRYSGNETKNARKEVFKFAGLENYNDFLLAGLSETYSIGGTVTATFADGQLYMNGSDDLQ